MSFAIIRSFLILFFSFGIVLVYGVVIGSDSACSRQSAVTFYSVDTDNRMNGFGFFEGGFTFENVSTTCTFDSFFPVSGSIDMKGGILSLQKDLICSDGATIKDFGSIYGNEKAMRFGESVVGVNSTKFSLGLVQTAQVTPLTTAVNSVDWSPNGNYVTDVVTGANGNDLHVYSVDRSLHTLTLVTGAILTGSGFSVRWNPKASYIAVARDTPEDATNPQLRVYPFNTGTNTLGTPVSQDFLGNVNAVAWYRDGNYCAVGTDIAGNYLRTYKFSTSAGTIGAALTISSQPGGAVSRECLDWDVTGSYLAVGISTISAAELLIYYLQDANTLTLTNQINIPDATTVTSLDWSPTDSLLAVGLSESADRLRVYEFDYNPAHWVFAERTTCRVGETNTVSAVAWSPDGLRLATGFAANTGKEMKVYNVANRSYLQLLGDVEFGADINSVRWDYNGTHVATGDSAMHMTLFSANVPQNAYFYDIVFSLANNVSWYTPTKFRGNCTINGVGNKLSFKDFGALIVTAGATLTLKNVELEGVSSGSLFCEDNTSRLVLKNCIVNLSAPFEVAKGSLYFAQDVIFSGTSPFTYSSIMTSTIATQSRLYFDKGSSFSYTPVNSNRDLLYMTDSSSCLYFDGASLKSSAIGMRLTRGRLFMDNGVTFSAQGNTLAQSICLGNGIASGDLLAKLLSGAELNVYGGFNYNDVV